MEKVGGARTGLPEIGAKSGCCERADWFAVTVKGVYSELLLEIGAAQRLGVRGGQQFS